MAKAKTQYEQLVSVVGNGTTVSLVPGATMGSRLAFEVTIPNFGTLFLSADRRVTKVVRASGETIIKPKPEQRAEVFAAIADSVREAVAA